MTPTGTFGFAISALLMRSLWVLSASAQTPSALVPEVSVPDTADAAASAALPYPSRFVEVHGIRMHYIDEGKGDPILFLHGNPDHLYVWRNLIPYAARVGRAIAVDLAGMGRSEVPDGSLRFFDHARYLEGFINALGLRNITLVVHDWGGTLGFDYAHRHERNVRGLMFMETALGPIANWETFPAAARAAFRQFRTPDVGWDLIVQQNAMGEGPRTIRVLTEAERAHYRRPLDNPARRKPVWRFVNEIPIAGEPADTHAMLSALHDWLQETTLPKLLVYTTPGVILGETDVAWCRQHLKHLDTMHAGPGFHYPQEENPDGMGRAFLAWYRSR